MNKICIVGVGSDDFHTGDRENSFSCFVAGSILISLSYELPKLLNGEICFRRRTMNLNVFFLTWKSQVITLTDGILFWGGVNPVRPDNSLLMRGGVFK
jgi:hypothetical protein